MVPAPPSPADTHPLFPPYAVRVMDPESVVHPVSAMRPPPPEQVVGFAPPLDVIDPAPVVVMVVASIQTEPPDPPPLKVLGFAPLTLMVPSTVTVAATIFTAPPPAPAEV